MTESLPSTGNRGPETHAAPLLAVQALRKSFGGVYAMTVTQRFLAHDIAELPSERTSSALRTR